VDVNLPTARARSGAASLLAVHSGVFCSKAVVAATVPFAVNFDLWG